MSGPRTSPTSWVQLLQALVARELVEEMGVPTSRAAELLGLAPSAVSQYLSGRRLRGPFFAWSTHPEARAVARDLAERLRDPSAPGGAGAAPAREILHAAAGLAEALGGTTTPAPAGARIPSAEAGIASRGMVRWLRHRVRAEQTAVAMCMPLAQKARDELTRAIFRQIASDSLRHAEIVASLEPYLSQGILRSPVSGVTHKDVETLLEGERRAEARPEGTIEPSVGGTMRLLLESMEADERKHTALLNGLLEATSEGTPDRKRGRLPGAS